jgi:lipopolysaccharide/colanic/teichoic acid biosynthesis glycosyltransferase
MAIVGPRPERPVFVNQFESLSPYFTLRNSVRPGITGWAQVMYGYASGSDEALEKLSYDLYYIKHFSLRQDLEILLRTVSVVLWGKGR